MNENAFNYGTDFKTPASENALALARRLQRIAAAQRASGVELLSPGEWLRRVGGLQAPFGFDGMPTVLG